MKKVLIRIIEFIVVLAFILAFCMADNLMK